MKALHYIACLCASMLLLSCSSSQFVIEKNPKKNNPVDKVAWLKEQKKELSTSRCRITLYEKDGQTYYEIYKPTPGAYDQKTTTLFDETGKSVLVYGGLMPPARRVAVDRFLKSAEKKGVIWECTPKEKSKKEK